MDDTLRGWSVAPASATFVAEPSLKERYRFPPGQEGALWYHDASEYRHPRHRHSGIEVNLVIAGTAVYLVQDRIVRASRRSALWFFPDQDRVLLDQSSDYRMLIILFTPSLLRRAVDSKTADQTFRSSSPDEEHCRILAPNMARLVVENCAMLLGNSSKHLLNAGIAYVLRVLWASYNAAPSRPRRPQVDPYLVKAVRVLQEDPTCSGTELARAVDLSRSHLSRRFCDHMGVSLVRFRNQLRVEAFLRLVEDNGSGVSHAAHHAGFGSYGQFHRVFREATGMSARDYLSRRISRR